MERGNMFFWSELKKSWQRLLKSLPHDGRQKLLEILRREYTEEMESTLQFFRHADCMHYPQFRERLLRIAKDEQKHAQWLEERIIALGGEIPHVSFTPEEGFNSWECLRLDLEEERHCRADLIDRLPLVEKIDPETAKILTRILKEEENHREQITDMLMRSDPEAVWPV